MAIKRNIRGFGAKSFFNPEWVRKLNPRSNMLDVLVWICLVGGILEIGYKG